MSVARATPVFLLLLTAAGGFAFGPLGAGLPLGLGLVFVAAVAVLQRPAGVAAPVSVSASADLDPPLARFDEGLMPFVLAGLGLRLLFVVLLNASSLWRSFGPDAQAYEFWGGELADYWTGVSSRPPSFYLHLKQSFYPTLNGVLSLVFSNVRWVGAAINAFVGVFVAWLFGHLGAKVYTPEVGRRVFLVALFFPSLVIWSSMNLRDVWSHLALATMLIAIQSLRDRFSLVNLGLVALSFFWVYVIRSYLIPIVFLAAVMSYVVVSARQIPYAIVGLLMLGVFVNNFGDTLGFQPELMSTQSLEKIQSMRQGLAYGGSAYGTDVDTTTVSGTLLYLPQAILRFLFSPYPWAIRSWQQALTLVEGFFWYYIAYLAVRRIIADATRQLPRIAVIFFSLLMLTIPYALVAGNEGTAYRHRAQVLFLFFIFAAAQNVYGKAAAPARPGG